MKMTTEVVGGSSLVAAGMPAALKVADIPWYETSMWLSVMAGGLAILGLLSIIQKIVEINRDIKANKSQEEES